MKKLIVCALCIVLTLALVACGGNPSTWGTGNQETVNDTDGAPIGGDPKTWGPANQTATDGEDENIQIPNPWQECGSLEEAAKVAGFSFAAPESVEGYSETYIAAIENDIAEVIFSKGEDDDAQVSFRKGIGSEDVSGDYNTYDSVETRKINGKDVTVKSNDSVIYTATWTDGDYSYAISARTGMTEEQLSGWVQVLA